jgi:hypothetical protein
MGISEGFTKRYGLKRLIYAEHHEDIRSAIRREKTLKHWPGPGRCGSSMPRIRAGPTFTIS